MLTVISAAETQPVSVEEVKSHLRELSNDFDDVIPGLIAAATAAVGHHTGRTLAPTGYELRGDSWSNPICLPALPVRSVDEVAYIDVDGDEQVLSADSWYFYLTDMGAEVAFVPTASLPSLYDRPQSVRVRFTAGYDDPYSSESGLDHPLPSTVRMAVLFLIGTWFDNGAHLQDRQTYEVPDTFKYLANQLRIFR